MMIEKETAVTSAMHERIHASYCLIYAGKVMKLQQRLTLRLPERLYFLHV